MEDSSPSRLDAFWALSLIRFSSPSLTSIHDLISAALLRRKRPSIRSSSERLSIGPMPFSNAPDNMEKAVSGTASRTFSFHPFCKISLWIEAALVIPFFIFGER